MVLRTPLLIYRHQRRMTELCTNLPSGIYLSLRVFPPFKLVLFGSGYRPRSWLLRRRWVPSWGGPFSADASSIDALSAVIIPYVIIMTESDPIKVLLYGVVCPSHICCVRSAGTLRGAGLDVYSYIKHDE
jgi:hypothetical protein